MIVVFTHFRQGYGRHGGSGGVGGTADGCKTGARAHRGNRHAARPVPHEFVGDVKQPAADAGMKCNLPHEYEKRNNGEIVTAENIEDILGHHAECGIKAHHRAETHNAYQRHEKSNGHF